MSQSASQWKQHPTHPDVECSSDGVIRNVVTGRVYAQHKDRDGYLHTTISSRGVGKKSGMVHRFIAEAFNGGTDSRTVNHKNGRKDDNRAINLEFVTHRENVAHARNTLGEYAGERNSRAKLTELQVRQIREMAASGTPRRVIAATFGIIPEYVNDIRTRRVWKEVA